jgi:hypothetical protein
MRGIAGVELGPAAAEAGERVGGGGNEQQLGERRLRLLRQPGERLDEREAGEQLRDDDVMPRSQVGSGHLHTEVAGEQHRLFMRLPAPDRGAHGIDVQHQRQGVF